MLKETFPKQPQSFESAPIQIDVASQIAVAPLAFSETGLFPA
jgi:hypothetical protein